MEMTIKCYLVSLKSLVALIEYDIRVQRKERIGDENSDYSKAL
jgi:hypothetical protein